MALCPMLAGGGDGMPKRSVGLVTRSQRRVPSSEIVGAVCGEVGWFTSVSIGFSCSMRRR